jgi:hypothetical protein
VAKGTTGYTAGSAISGTIVNLQNVIKVDSTADFPNSGTIVIGEEMIAYSAKADGTTFTVSSAADNVRNVVLTTTVNGDQTAIATTINVADASTFPATGILKIATTNFELEYVSYTGKTATSFTGCTRGYYDTKPAALGTGSIVVLYFKAVAHPRGVLVYKYVTSPDANSSIGLKGRHTLTLRLERASNIFDVEAQSSRYLELHKWGDQNAEITVPTYFDYGAVMLGDKITMNDSTLSWSSYAVRVLEKTLTIDRSSGNYDLHYVVATYSDVPAEGNSSKDVQDFILSMTGAKEGTVNVAGTDTDFTYGTPLATSGGVNSLFKVPSGTAAFTNENMNGYVFTNNLWINGSMGACFTRPFSVYGVEIATTGLFFPVQYTTVGAPSAVGVEGSIYYDTTDNVLKYSDNSSWINIGSGVGWVEAGNDLQLDTGYTNLLLYPASGSTNILVDSDITPISGGNYDLGSATDYWNVIYSATSNADFINGMNNAYITFGDKIIPSSDATLDIGSAAKTWNVAYIVSTDTDFLNPLANGYITVGDDIRPSADVTYTLGTSSYQWLAVYTRKLICSTESTARLRLPVGMNMYG